MQQNIKYELQEIERILAEGERNARQGDFVRQGLEEKLQDEVQRIKRTLTHEVFNFDDERHLERYIQLHQQTIISLLDRIEHQSSTPSSGIKEFYKHINAHLEQVLRFIERHFTKYFDQDAKAPAGYLMLARKELADSAEKFTVAFHQLKVDEILISLVLQPVINITESDTERSITYRQVMYAKEMQKELMAIIERGAMKEINEELRQIMYYLNLNSVKVITYHAHYISSLLESAETRNEKIEKLSLVIKTISQAQVKPGVSYNQQAESLKEQLLEFVTIELEYQERLHRLNAPSTPGSGGPLSGFKLKFDASVSQLAYLIKVFMETKFLANTNLTHIIQFLSVFAITKKSEALSFTSFRTKFYNVETGTKQSVRGLLTSMIQYIDRS